MDQPFISIVILTYKRKEELLKSIESALSQNYENFEVIVVDNHSEDGTVTLVNKHFPEVKLIALQENIGTGGRNIGIENAQGAIVVTLDNDVSFASCDGLQAVAQCFNEKPKLCCITFKMLYKDTGQLSTRDWVHPFEQKKFSNKRFPTYYINEGAAAFKKELLLKAGLYDQNLFLGHEGFDLAIRIFDSGYQIEYTPEVVVLHDISEETRTSWRLIYYNTRNYFLIGRKYFSLYLAIRFIFPRLIAHGIFAYRTSQLDTYFKAVGEGVKAAINNSQLRKPVKKATENLILQLAANKPGMLAWFKRHRAKPLF